MIRIQLDDGLLVIRAPDPEVQAFGRKQGREAVVFLSITGPRGRAVFDSVIRRGTVQRLIAGLNELMEELPE